MITWQTYAKKLPHVTVLTDVASYADAFDAINEARARTTRWEPSPTDYEVLGKMTVTRADGTAGEEDFIVARQPTTPVRSANTMRLAIAMMQFELWEAAKHFARFAGPEIAATAMLPSGGALLSRKLRPTDDEVADVAQFLITPHCNPKMKADYGEPNPAVFRFLEKHVEPPASKVVRRVLVEMRRRLGVVRDEAAEIRHKSGGKPQMTRFDKWFGRIDRMIGT
jgi:hypothetical protein